MVPFNVYDWFLKVCLICIELMWQMRFITCYCWSLMIGMSLLCYSIFCGWQCWLVFLIIQSYILINLLSSRNDCCVYKVLAETFWNYKTVPNINLPNIDDTCIYLRLCKWKVNFIYIVRFTCKWKVCLMKKYSKESRFIILWYIK